MVSTLFRDSPNMSFVNRNIDEIKDKLSKPLALDYGALYNCKLFMVSEKAIKKK